MPTKAYIAVYIGDPVDFTKYRHTALFFEFPSYSLLMHITGAQGFFEFQKQEDYDPRNSRKLASLIKVDDISDSFTPTSIESIVSTTPIRNGRADRDWNCHNWVGEALNRLIEAGSLEFSKREAAVDKMIDICMEARHEE
ncbi:hypothetical protein ASPWEDRAFT_307648 [Aspergillus wentii DTO 134E9]|uniref:PPPDE domain-containing protein n=1 Tax=Aspergillus wentii DTO 134E9 TaxID=1073089 RepID=A0A1L9RSX4_ASPWE|nr:uncharacterized protein ASPWEDRAFT_307648 [Aspergillus wentii DTO 134E9]OJJ38032.1 hypothetical protein ASPWEDRAFT_307648 [Aspergillus wentii DTO 134E9]